MLHQIMKQAEVTNVRTDISDYNVQRNHLETLLKGYKDRLKLAGTNEIERKKVVAEIQLDFYNKTMDFGKQLLENT